MRRSPALFTFGEGLLTFRPLRAAPALSLAPGASTCLRAVGGAELNVAAAFVRASGAERSATWVSVLPAGPLGDLVRDAAAECGVSTDHTHAVADPTMGTLHIVDVDGAGPAPVYQRHHSAFCTSVRADSFDWGALLGGGAKWLHLTGLTPLLGAGPRAAWELAMQAAAKHPTLRTSLDLNHRPALGSAGWI